MTWLRINSRPPRQYYRDSRSLPLLTAREARHELLQSVGTIRSGVEGEAPNVTVTLRNTGARCLSLLADPPIGDEAALIDADGTIFSGIVRSIDLDGAECRIGIEA